MRILIFSAHPDDAEFAAGGTLLLLAKKHDVTIATMTDGGAGSHGNADIRKQEQEKAAKYAGAKLIWQGLGDTTLEHNRKHTLRVAQIIRNEQPDVIIAPHWDQQGSVTNYRAHPEHRIMGQLVKDAARYARFNVNDLHGERHRTEHLLWYMVPAHRTAKIAIDITPVKNKLKGLWNCHKSQHQLVGGKLEQHLLDQREHKHYDLEFAEHLDSDEPISSTLLSKLFS